MASVELRTKNMCGEAKGCKGYSRQKSPFTNRVLSLRYSENDMLFTWRRWSLICNFTYQVILLYSLSNYANQYIFSLLYFRTCDPVVSVRPSSSCGFA